MRDRVTRARVLGLGLSLTCLAVACLALSGAALAKPLLSLHSPAITPGQTMAPRFSCDGAGQSPPLMIQGVPDKTRSLVIEVIDPDAPGGTFTHWGLYNLAPRVAFLAAGAASHDLPGPASSISNGFHQAGYGAICPPAGQRHHYRFILYALDTRLSGKPADRRALTEAMHGHILARAAFDAPYQRP